MFSGVEVRVNIADWHDRVTAGHGGDEPLVLAIEASKEVADELLRLEWLSDGRQGIGKSFDTVEVDTCRCVGPGFLNPESSVITQCYSLDQ